MKRRRQPATGFTLTEVVIVLAMAVVLVGLLAPAIFRSIESGRDETTRRQLRAIVEAVLGDPAKGTLGYVGDVGDLPDALSDLIVRPASFPAYAITHTAGVGMGWRGPYVDRGTFSGDEFKDDWGAALEWGGKTGAGGGRTGRGQVRSAGPDGVMGTTDDILFPLDPVETNGTLLITVHVNNSPNPKGVTLTVYKTVNGAEAVHATQSTASGFTGFSFTVPQGIHALKATHTSNTVAGSSVNPPITVEKVQTVTVRGRNQHHLEIRLRTSGDVTP